MIAFGCSIISPEVYARCAAPGIGRVTEPDSEVFVFQAAGTISRTYNLILDYAARCSDLEALVLVHEDAELLDPGFCRTLRAALEDPYVAVVGCIGAVGVRSIAWWDGTTTRGSYIQRYGEFGGGEARPFASTGPRAGEVDAVDGFVLALSPWAVRNVRFDEALGPHWGYDLDLCFQVRAAGRKVLTAKLEAAHHHPLLLARDIEPWIAAHMRAAEKWDRDDGSVDWKARARRAEAEAVVARLQGAATLLQTDAKTALHARRMNEVTSSPSWRSTAPLRWLNGRRRAVAGWRARRRAS